MKTILTYLPIITAYLFVLLFTYAAFSKIFDFEMFQIQLAQSPLLSAFAGWISYGVILAELIISFLLLINKTRITGLYLATALMAAFSFYIYLILNFSDFVPCSCGGVLEKLSWSQHLLFNIFFVIAGVFAIFLEEHVRKILNWKISFRIFTVNMVALLGVWFLFQRSEFIIKKENNFVRRYLPHPISEVSKMELGSSTFVFAGSDSTYIFLYDVKVPFSYTQIDHGLRKSSVKNLKLPYDNNLYKNPKFIAQNGKFYFGDGTIPVVMKKENNLFYPIIQQQFYFDQLAVSDSNNFAFRTISAKSKKHVLGLYADNKLVIYDSILSRQTESIFDTDGRLLHDSNTDKLLYIYTYRNQFAVMDHNLENVKNQNTIDASTGENLKSKRTSTGEHKLTSPAIPVNKNAFYFSGLLFNQSGLIGKYEDKGLWKRFAVIDVYDTVEGIYTGSFYVPVKRKNAVIELFVQGIYLYIIADKELRKYRFAQNITKHFSKGEAEKP